MAQIGCSETSVIAQKSAVFEEEFKFGNMLTFVRGCKETPRFLDDILKEKFS